MEIFYSNAETPLRLCEKLRDFAVSKGKLASCTKRFQKLNRKNPHPSNFIPTLALCKKQA